MAFNPSHKDQTESVYAKTARPAKKRNLKLKSTICVDKSPRVNTTEEITIFCLLFKFSFTFFESFQKRQDSASEADPLDPKDRKDFSPYFATNFNT
ncbi:MAG: hypothetical protein UT77_C0008G0023 [Candidatus Daviesbacteria bacterium GW2011_GWC2_40_12]|uniref:Uncharacterized protein n=1 Tax=Candidatus Daviesbacteria bacterium GW2011_GWC2_40_12 TaxID=1618431 RepID=A0A0G0QWC8_9BACT|nr:MAG: hypothetical protein UT04_C0002G0005 [Candidatus Daviesbacteria bacterium GW2011_GWF2_38_7]KKR16083.1 MAG: hypothetical protein UT45_C0009G0023 [Candidatus Daviesbacteria bacterium GW2011_GWA2_39_33]KKR41651.1 MAG: hypothetical protein UT77_C0008G0023 [Candidatus Daviesbacteria bacterium GW2011_GWC2_40_12]